MGDKQFTNPTGAYGYTVDADIIGCIFFPMKVAESSSAAVTVTRGQIVQPYTTVGTVLGVDTAQTDMILGVALETVTIPDTDLIQAVQYTGPRTVDVCVFGGALVLSGGTDLAAFTTLASDASGRAIEVTEADANWILGHALEATGDTAGVLKSAWINPQKIELS